MQCFTHIQLVFFLLVAGFNGASAQSKNLVPNASFEIHKAMPNNVAQGSKCISFWKIPNKIGQAEYYHANCKTKKAGTNKNHYGKQAPHSGAAYMGICITKRFREYLQIKLSSPLIKDKQYRIEVFVSCGDKLSLGSVNEFNVIFSQKPFRITSNKKLLVSPQIKFFGDLKNKKDWVELSTVYTANGTEQYLTFGAFPYIENGVIHGEINGLGKYAHYYVDDISVTMINDESEKTPEISVQESELLDTVMTYNMGEVYVLDNLFFESGESVLLPNDYPELEALVQFLENKSDFKLLITGHTDNVGSKTSNKQLSYDRAKAVKTYLIEKGINADAIVIDGKGDSNPIRSNATEEGRKKNRRVEISITN